MVPPSTAHPFFHYFRTLGGVKGIIASGYLWSALGLLLITRASWVSSSDWFDLVIAVLPNLLGFSIGGFAIFLSMGDEEYRRVICGTTEGTPSPYMEICAVFTHFVMVQALAILVAIIAKSHPVAALELDQAALRYLAPAAIAFRAFGYLLFLYAIVLAIAAVEAIWRVARTYDEDVSSRPKQG